MEQNDISDTSLPTFTFSSLRNNELDSVRRSSSANSLENFSCRSIRSISSSSDFQSLDFELNTTTRIITPLRQNYFTLSNITTSSPHNEIIIPCDENDIQILCTEIAKGVFKPLNQRSHTLINTTQNSEINNTTSTQTTIRPASEATTTNREDHNVNINLQFSTSSDSLEIECCSFIFNRCFSGSDKVTPYNSDY